MARNGQGTGLDGRGPVSRALLGAGSRVLIHGSSFGKGRSRSRRRPSATSSAIAVVMPGRMPEGRSANMPIATRPPVVASQNGGTPIAFRPKDGPIRI